MSTRDASNQDDPVIESRDQLVAPMRNGEKPKAAWRIGTEHEKFAYHLDGYRSLDYEGKVGIRAFLVSMTRFGWQPVMEGNNVIALTNDTGASISLEPAGQLELAPAMRAFRSNQPERHRIVLAVWSCDGRIRLSCSVPPSTRAVNSFGRLRFRAWFINPFN